MINQSSISILQKANVTLLFSIALAGGLIAAAHSKVIGKYQTMTPVFDSSLPKPKVFELNVKHTEMFQPPVELHGDTKLIELQAKKDSIEPLRGQVSTDEKLPDSTISTVEHDVTPRFFVDLRKLEAKYAPDLAQMMQAALAAARRREAEQIAREEPLMERKLKERKAAPDIVVPTRKDANAASDLLQNKLDQSKKNDVLQANTKGQNLQSAIAEAQAQAAKRPSMPDVSMRMHVQMPANALAKLPDLPVAALPKVEMPQQNAVPKVQIPEAKPQVNKIPVPKSPLVAIPNQLPDRGPKIIPEVRGNLSVPDVNSAINAARDKAQRAMNQVAPAVDAVLTYLRKPASVKDPASTSTELALDAASVIEWDKWHAAFAASARQPILKCVDELGNPSGFNTVQVTVWPNRHIEVRLPKSGTNKLFDEAILKAYRSLEGSAVLAYPKGSRRSSVSFLIDNKHEGAGRPTAVNSQSSVGDKEVIRLNSFTGNKKP